MPAYCSDPGSSQGLRKLIWQTPSRVLQTLVHSEAYIKLTQAAPSAPGSFHIRAFCEHLRTHTPIPHQHHGSSGPKWPLWYQAPGRLSGIQVPVTPRHLPTPVHQVAHVTSGPHWAPVNLKAVSLQCLPTPAAPDTSYGSRQFSKQHSLWAPVNPGPVSSYTCLFQKPQVVFVAQIFFQVPYNSDPQLITMPAGFSGPRQPPYGLRWYP